MTSLLRRHALAVLVAFALPAVAQGGNGSNYVHLTNGLDYFFGKSPPQGQLTGIWRCFPSEILHAPTLSTDPSSPYFATYTSKVCAVHVAIFPSPNSTITFPTIALTSSQGKCKFLTTAGTVNYAIFSVAGFGSIVGGPLTGNNGPVPVNFLAGIANTSLPAPGVSGIVLVTLAFGQPVDVPEGDSLVVWVQDKPFQSPGNMQYWTGSFDERNLCSGYSFLLSTSGTMLSFLRSLEWGVGLGTKDATLSAAINSLGPGPSGLNAHDASQGFNPGFDAGSGTRTISITGTGGGPGPGLPANIGSEFLGFNVYDEASAATGGSNRIVLINVWGIDTAGATCNTRSATFVEFPTGGPGGPVLVPFLPTQPRSVGKIDTLTLQMLANPTWVASTGFSTAPGGNNIPFFPAPAANGGSNAGGNVGGFPLAIPTGAAHLIGTHVFCWSIAVDPTQSFLVPGLNAGHSSTNGYDILFFP